MELLEREPLLAALGEYRTRAGSGAGGTLVFVEGEAGIGKTALTRGFLAALPAGTAVYQGFCDALGTPRALGPLHDIARSAPDRLAPLLSAGAERHAAFTAFLDVIGAGPSVTVIEDVHWADAATLDLLLFVGRRVADLPAVVVVTYRADDVGRDHPLRRVLGDLATVPSVRRLTVPPLTVAAVVALAAPTGQDGVALHGASGGNPFFVTEVLGAQVQHVPTTVRDAVLARTSRLGPEARTVLDAVSLVTGRAETALLEYVLQDPGLRESMEPPAVAVAIDDAVAAGMLVLEQRTVRFRHELARRAVEVEVPAARAAVLHARVLAFLVGTRSADPARLAFHADAAGDPMAVLHHAPLAGDLATGVGAHREAAEHFARALRHAAGSPAALRADLWQRRSMACERCGDLAGALDASGRAITEWLAAGAPGKAAAVRASRSHVLWMAGRNAEANEAAAAAVAMLTSMPSGPGLAAGYAAPARLRMLARDFPEAITLGTTAIEYAARYGDISTLGRALNTVGSAHWFTDPDRALELLTDSLEAARHTHDDSSIGQAMNNIGSGAGEVRRYALADEWIAETIRFCTDRDLDPSLGYATAWHARSMFEQGRWAEATLAATEVVRVHVQHVPSRIVALTVLGRLRVRRGDPDAVQPLEQAQALAEQTGDLQRLWPVAAARAEAAWLAGAPERIEELVAPTYRLAVSRQHDWAIGELGYWRSLGGVAPDPDAGAARPFALQIAGAGAAAAQLWQELGCPYEAAIALSESSEPDDRLAALSSLRDMGAWPAADQLARRLRGDGVLSLPRRPRRATRANPAQLTDRQLDVLMLLAGGLRNADIATELHISAKTVDHHVSAVLAKLGVGTRQEAARSLAQWERSRQGEDGEPAPER
ncbi:ATP-binding protein [Pseudonocardia sp. GCM10023141]|uniref:ATP-binding protein n=1 Tax=Pseudonocardia sp. GCM10023141 TaxID=3252653 RepID=UPI003610B512